eukprot:scaffold78301_cov20-Cyclotella_meneghiniana.AAC.1
MIGSDSSNSSSISGVVVGAAGGDGVGALISFGRLSTVLAVEVTVAAAVATAESLTLSRPLNRLLLRFDRSRLILLALSLFD